MLSKTACSLGMTILQIDLLRSKPFTSTPTNDVFRKYLERLTSTSLICTLGHFWSDCFNYDDTGHTRVAQCQHEDGTVVVLWYLSEHHGTYGDAMSASAAGNRCAMM